MRIPLSAVILSVIAIAAPAWAQTSLERFQRTLDQIERDQRLRANPEVPAEQRALLDYGGYLSYSFFAIDDIHAQTHILNQYDLIAYARLNIDNVHEVFVRARTGYQDWKKGESFDGEGDQTIWPRLEQAYYRFDLARALSAYKGKTTDYNVVIQGGRQFVYWGNGLVLAQYLDGGMVDLSAGPVNLHLLGGVTWGRTTDFDSSRPQFDDSTYRGFYGAMLSAQIAKHRPYVYGMIQRDYNDSPPLVLGATTTNFDYNSYYIGAGSKGSFGDRLTYGLEVVFEGGRNLSNSFDSTALTPVPQEKTDIAAGALDYRMDYVFGDPHRSRISFETIMATGDPDRLNTTNTFGGNRPGGDDTAFNALGLLNTGLAFAPAASNLMSFRLGASTYPFTSGNLRRLQVGSDVLLFFKFREDAPIDETTHNQHYLGWEPDIYLNWQITSDITLALRYGVFFPGSAIVSDEHPRNFVFAGITFAF